MSEERARAIAEELKKGIGEGKYGAERPLPSVRALMNRYAVAHVTAHRALQCLVRAGLAESRHGRGVYPVVRTATTFGVIVPDAGSPLCSRICAGVANCAKTASFGGGATYRCSGRTRRSRSPSRTSASRPAWRARSSCGRRTPG